MRRKRTSQRQRILERLVFAGMLVGISIAATDMNVLALCGWVLSLLAFVSVCCLVRVIEAERYWHSLSRRRVW